MKRTLFFTVIYLLSISLLHAQVDTKGTDFWVSFGQNATEATIANSVILRIRIVTEAAATCSLQFTELGTSTTFSVPAGGVYTYDLTTIEKNAVYNAGGTKTSDKSVRIQSNVPVTVYALNSFAALADVTNVLPIPVLGNEYYHLGRVSSSTGTYKYDQYIVIATEDNTTVFENGTAVATLSTGEVYFKQASMTTDMSGYYITSDKPTAYFTAHSYCNIGGGGDNFFQQLPPINTWGKNFMVPVTNRTIEYVRVIASQNNTVITQTGGTIRAVAGGQSSLNLNAGQWVELRITLANNGCYIQADKPVQVCSYMLGSGNDGSTGQGDESLCWIPPVEQKVNSALLSPFATGNLFSTHFALIVTPTLTKNNTTIKIGTGPEDPLSGGTWYDNAVSGMSFYNIPLTNATASYIFANQAGIVAYAYGFGSSISYYYMAASSMRNLDLAFYVNDIHYQDLATEIICTQPTLFRAEISGDVSALPGYLKWYIDNVEEITAQDQLSWSKTLSNGTYAVKMEVLWDDNVTVKTIEAIMTVSSSCAGLITPSAGTVCSGTNSTTLLLSGYWGTITKWQSSISPFSSWTDISNTTATLTVTNLTQTTLYRAVINGVNITDPATVTVIPTVVPSVTISGVPD